MRMHIELDDELVADVDRIAGPRGRSAFVRGAIKAAVEGEGRLANLRRAAGSLSDTAHEWDDDPAGWVRRQRRDDRRAG